MREKIEIRASNTGERKTIEIWFRGKKIYELVAENDKITEKVEGNKIWEGKAGLFDFLSETDEINNALLGAFWEIASEVFGF